MRNAGAGMARLQLVFLPHASGSVVSPWGVNLTSPWLSSVPRPEFTTEPGWTEPWSPIMAFRAAGLRMDCLCMCNRLVVVPKSVGLWEGRPYIRKEGCIWVT